MLDRLANGGLLLAVVLGCLPLGMKAYGRWAQRQARAGFVIARPEARAADAEAAQRRTSPSIQPRRRWETCVLQIPSIGVDAVVTEGAGRWELVTGPGHLPETAGPGGRGNCVIGAHRNLWDATFADLPRLKPGDRVNLTTTSDRFTYLIDDSREVKVSDKRPLSETKGACLTLITCVLPFNKGRRWMAHGHLTL